MILCLCQDIFDEIYLPITFEHINNLNIICFRLIKVYREPDIPEEIKEPVTLFVKEAECYYGPVPERRVHPSSVKLNITAPHSVQSNPGYSRKIDGTFYST